MLFDESTKRTRAFLLPPDAYDADETSAAFDIGQASACGIVIGVGEGGITFNGTNKVEFKLQHSDNGSDFSAVALEHVKGVSAVGTGGIVRALTAAHATPSVVEVGYIGGKRYLRMFTDFSGTHGTATPMFVMAIRGRLLSIDA